MSGAVERQFLPTCRTGSSSRLFDLIGFTSHRRRQNAMDGDTPPVNSWETTALRGISRDSSGPHLMCLPTGVW